jgi:hypothetical protein
MKYLFARAGIRKSTYELLTIIFLVQVPYPKSDCDTLGEPCVVKTPLT